MRLTYYGTRGSLPTPGKTTLKYGGNTTCLSFVSRERQYIIDAGSGLRVLGLNLMKTGFTGNGEAAFLWTHFHWDHLMGFPFFVPNFIKGNRFRHFGPTQTRDNLVRQQRFVNFPVEFDQMASDHEFTAVEPGQTFRLDHLEVRSCPMLHPGGGITYRVDDGKTSFVFATDVEHPEEGLDPELVRLSEGTDLLIYDAQYTPEEYAKGRKGWGHSTWIKAVETAKAAGARALHLCHHDQLHSDEFLETKILAPAKKAFPRTNLAREGRSVSL